MHNPSNNNCPRNADPRNESCACDTPRFSRPLKAPTVHLNGTAKTDLLEQLWAASCAVLNAIEQLQAASPNARDYYVQPAGTYEVAVDQHERRARKLHDVAQELAEISERVADQHDNRNRRSN